MKSIQKLPVLLLAGGLFSILSCPAAPAESSQDPIAVARSVIKADRQEAVKNALQLTPAEAEKFWPLYNDYRTDMAKIGDALVATVKEYAQYYPNVPDDRAQKLFKDYMDLEKKSSATRASYFHKTAKILPPSKNLRFVQIENRLDLALRLQLASEIPLLPIEGEIMPQAGAAMAVQPGTPGGAIVQVVEIKATVTAIDPATRSVTLLSPDGIKETIQAGPQVTNFDQIHVGDQLRIRATEELVVQMADAADTADDGSAAMVALAPKGEKPGGLAAQTTKVTATVKSIDTEKRTATLEFEDGTTRTLSVRDDVDLGKRAVGEKVVFRYTQMIGIALDKP